MERGFTHTAAGRMYVRGERGLGAKPGPFHLPTTEPSSRKWPAIGDGQAFGKNVMMVEMIECRNSFFGENLERWNGAHRLLNYWQRGPRQLPQWAPRTAAISTGGPHDRRGSTRRPMYRPGQGKAPALSALGAFSVCIAGKSRLPCAAP
jgi:hypothetical protein